MLHRRHHVIGICWVLASAFLHTSVQAQNWVAFSRRLSPQQLQSEPLRATARTVMAHQTPVGGWPKNKFYPALSAAERREWAQLRRQGAAALNQQATIDNNATTAEILFLLHMSQANKANAAFADSTYAAALRGIEYLLCMQYANGGFPQYWPRTDHYHACITFNDNAMTNALQVLIGFASARPPFDVLPPDSSLATTVELMRQRAIQACHRGIRCILDCQLRDSLGRKAVWCQQYAPTTLEPCGARSYELPSFCTAESIGILTFLRKNLREPIFDHPEQFTHDEVQQAILAAEQWLESHALTGMTREFFKDENGQRDYRIVPCLPDEQCPRMWARFYDLEHEQPLFVDRDGTPRTRVEAIGHERRNGYAWFNTSFDAYLHAYHPQ